MKIAIVLCLLPLAASFTFAQGGIDDIPADPQDYLVDWPSGPEFLPAAAFQRAAIGEIMGDSALHGVVHRGDRLFVVFDPINHRLVVPTSLVGVLSFDVLAAEGQHGSTDAVVYTTSAGLHRTEFVENAAQSDFLHVQSLEAGPWAGSSFVRCADIDGDGDMDLLGVSSGTQDLLIKRNLGGGTFSTTTLAPMGASIKDVAVADYNQSSSSLEFAVLTPTWLYFFSGANLSLPLARYAVGPTAEISSIQVGSGSARVAVSRDGAPDESDGQYELRTMDALSVDALPLDLQFTVPGGISPGSWIEPFALVSAPDIHGTGEAQDLCILHRSFGSAAWLRNGNSQAGPPTWTAVVSTWLPAGTNAMPNEEARPALRNLAVSGDRLGLFPLEASNGVFVHQETGLRGSMFQGKGLTDITVAQALIVDSEPGDSHPYELSLELSLPSTIPLGGPGYNAIQVAIWRELAEGAGITSNELNHVCAIVGQSTGGGNCMVRIPLTACTSVPGSNYLVPVAPAGLHEFMNIRLVRAEYSPDGQSVVSVSLPAAEHRLGLKVQSIASECTVEDGPCYDYLHDLPTSHGATKVRFIPNWTGGVDAGSKASADHFPPLTGLVARQPLAKGKDAILQ